MHAPDRRILSGCVDYVLPPDGIARELSRIGPSSLILAAHTDARVESLSDQEEIVIQRSFGLLRAQACGVDFSRYKRNTLLRRIRRRMGLCRIEQIGRLRAVGSRRSPMS